MGQDKASSTGPAAVAAAVVFIPVALLLSLVLFVATVTGAAAETASTDCGAAGTGQQVAGVQLDAEQLGNAHTIVQVSAGRQLPARAAVIAVATAYTESRLQNILQQLDHDSEGLFQQRVSIYTAAVADDPVRSTSAFLDVLVAQPGWASRALTDVAADVQRPRADLRGRYAQYEAMAAQVVGQLWPSAVQATAVTGATAGAAPLDSTVPVCPGGGGQGDVGAGITPVSTGTGRGVVSGSTSVPAGLIIDGSPPGQQAVRFALAQLGKPYVWGAAGPGAYDCSGLMMAAWATAGVPLGHYTGLQVRAGTPVPTNLATAVPGDLVFIPGSLGTPTDPRHVAMVAGHIDTPTGRHLYLVQAPQTGIPIEVTDSAEWAGRIVAVRHIG